MSAPQQKQICQVYDSAECCRNIHPDSSWQRAATQACQVSARLFGAGIMPGWCEMHGCSCWFGGAALCACQVAVAASAAVVQHHVYPPPPAVAPTTQSLSEYLADINHHQGLYNKLVDVQTAYDKASQAADAPAAPAAAGGKQQDDSSTAHVPLLSRQQLAELCPDTLIVAAKYRHDFEKFGIHLQDEQQRAAVARLLAQQQHFPARFNAALVRREQGLLTLCRTR